MPDNTSTTTFRPRLALPQPRSWGWAAIPFVGYFDRPSYATAPQIRHDFVTFGATREDGSDGRYARVVGTDIIPTIETGDAGKLKAALPETRVFPEDRDVFVPHSVSMTQGSQTLSRQDGLTSVTTGAVVAVAGGAALYAAGGVALTALSCTGVGLVAVGAIALGFGIGRLCGWW